MLFNRVAGCLVCTVATIGLWVGSALADPSGGDCCANNGGIGCGDPDCEAVICMLDPFCCTTAWDELCADEAAAFCPVCGGTPFICGNGFIDPGEQCDDGDNDSGDGCSSACDIEPEGACCVGSVCELWTQGQCDSAGGEHQGNGTACFESQVQVYQASPNLAIPDEDSNPGNPPFVVTDTIDIIDAADVLDVDVGLTITHTWIGDLCVSLSHGDKTVILMQEIGNLTSGCVTDDFYGCPCDNLEVTLDDEGGGQLEIGVLNCEDADLIACDTPATSYVPLQLLGLFDGSSAAGPWTLALSDSTLGDSGNLLSWSLRVATEGAPDTKCSGKCSVDADCADSDPCSDDVCTQGTCANPPAAAGTPCGSNADTECDYPDTCDGTGQCLTNSASDGTACTSDGNGCTTDICSAGVCAHPPAPVGKPCGSNANTDCDNPDRCNVAGQCLTHNEPDGMACTTDENDCTADTCNAGVCEHSNRPDGSSCSSDSNPCTVDICNGGVCAHSLAPAGTACGSNSDTDCDNPDTCNDLGVCLTNSASDGTVCASDGNACTGDVCSGGVCAHAPVPAGTACGSNADTECDNPDSCNAAGQCQTHNATNGTVCNDGSVCTTADFCQAGVCIGGPAMSCDDDDGCTVDSCHTVLGCLHSSAFCPEGRVCVDGLCVPAPECEDDSDCDDDDLCTEDTCVGENCRNASIDGCCVDDFDCAEDEECDPGTHTCEPGVGPAEPQPPEPPMGVSASDGSFADYVRISWNVVAQADEYRVFRCGTSEVSTCIAASDWISIINFDDRSALPGVTYPYRVKARNEDGESDFGVADTGFLAEQMSPEQPMPCTSDDECDDGAFCNGDERCVEGECVEGDSPCSTGETCEEATDSCTADSDDSCGAGLGCTPSAPFLGLLLLGLAGLRLNRMRRGADQSGE